MSENTTKMTERSSTISLSNMTAMQEGLKKLPHVLSNLGYDSMRPGQDRAVKSVLAGRDTITILPTATGKSACFKIPALCMGWRTIIIYPLVALMRDQVTAMQREGLAAASISSHETDAHNASVIRDWASGELQFMLVSPERFSNPEWASIVREFPPDFVAMDECGSGDTEVLTDRGFVRFDALDKTEKVAQYDPTNGQITFVKPSRWIAKSPTTPLLSLSNGSGADFRFTSGHNMLVHDKRRGELWKVNLGVMKMTSYNHLLKAGEAAGPQSALSGWERFLIAAQADGHLVGRQLHFKLRKLRKKQALVRILKAASIDPYAVVEDADGQGSTLWKIDLRELPRLTRDVASHFDLAQLGATKCRAIIEEANGWEGHKVAGSDVSYLITTTDQKTADFYQSVALLGGYGTTLGVTPDDRSEAFSDVWRLRIHKERVSYSTQTFETTEVEEQPEKVYCVTVPTGCIVVRRNGKPVVVGNCHTFHDWADTFRHGYKSAGEFIQMVRPKVVAAYSATLSEDAEKEVRAGLGINGAHLVYHYPRRKNLNLSSLELDRMTDAYPWVVENCEGPTIIYASTRKRTAEYAEGIQRYTDRPVMFYHGGMKATERKYEQDAFMKASNAIIVATNAFGMGVDKPDIRNVVHFDLPGNLVALAQEIGRAGRDGQESYCTLIPTAAGIRTRKHFIRCGNPAPSDIRAFYKAAVQMREGPTGPVASKRADIISRAGLDPFLEQAIMTFCLGEKIFGYDMTAAKKHRIRFAESIPTMTPAQKATRSAIIDIGVDDEDHWIKIDIDALSEQLGKEAPTIMSRLRKMHKDGMIEWVRASTAKPLTILKSPDEVPAASFKRLADKAREAENDLQLVLDYAEEADDAKHSFLESHLNR